MDAPIPSRLRAVTVGGLQGPPCHPTLPGKNKRKKENSWGWLWYHLPSFGVNPEEEGIRVNYRSLQKLCVFLLRPSGSSDNATISGGVTTEDLPPRLKPAMQCAGS